MPLEKGSQEAKEWSKKMLAAKAAKQSSKMQGGYLEPNELPAVLKFARDFNEPKPSPLVQQQDLPMPDFTVSDSMVGSGMTCDVGCRCPMCCDPLPVKKVVKRTGRKLVKK